MPGHVHVVRINFEICSFCSIRIHIGIGSSFCFVIVVILPEGLRNGINDHFDKERIIRLLGGQQGRHVDIHIRVITVTVQNPIPEVEATTGNGRHIVPVGQAVIVFALASRRRSRGMVMAMAMAMVMTPWSSF